MVATWRMAPPQTLTQSNGVWGLVPSSVQGRHAKSVLSTMPLALLPPFRTPAAQVKHDIFGQVRFLCLITEKKADDS